MLGSPKHPGLARWKSFLKFVTQFWKYESRFRKPGCSRTTVQSTANKSFAEATRRDTTGEQREEEPLPRGNLEERKVSSGGEQR